MSSDTIRRALELADEGRCRTVEDIRKQLTQERYEGVHAHLAGGSIKAQLHKILSARRLRGMSVELPSAKSGGASCPEQ